MSAYIDLLLAEPTKEHPSEIFNKIDAVRDEYRTDMTSDAARILNRCDELESQVHSLYTPFQFFVDQANERLR